jgi:hypothetical protein
MPIIKARASSIIESIDLRGTPTAPTAQQSVNTSQLASTAYVRTAVADLINSSPEVLDTLAELAAALGNDENFSVTVANSIATKVPLDGSVAMTGRLTLSADPVNNLHAVTKQYVDQAISDQMIYSTDDVSEGQTNLYYTNARVRSAVSLFSDNTTVLDYNSSTGEFTYNHPSTDGILEGSSNQYFTTARARNSISLSSDDATIISYSAQTGQISFTTPDTDQIAEGSTNLYFTTARARASLSNGSNIAYDSGTGVISTQAAVWSVNGQEHDVVLDTDDINEGSANLYFTQARARGSFSLTTDDSNILSYNSGSGTLTWVTPSTDAIDEGSSNLYYTDSRVRAAISGSGDISYNQATGNFSYSTPTTDGVNEGSTNLYYTNVRARNAVSLNTDNSDVLSYDNTTGEFTFSLGSQTTDDVAEGTNNLYFTTGRARNSISTSGWSNLSYNSSTGVISISSPSTSDVTEGTNLYYTDTRVRNALSAIHSAGDGDLTYDNTTGEFDYVGPTATDYRQAVSAVKDSGHGDFQYNSTTGVFTYTGPTNTNYRNAVSATDAGGDGSFDYNSATGVFTYTGPSASETRAHFSVTDTGGDGSLEYNSSTGVITYTGPSDSEVRAHFSVTDTGGDGSLEYNSSTGVFTYTGPSDSEVRAHFSVNDTGGDGSLEYNSSTGVITYTGPSASETRAHFSATTATGAQYNSSTGVISLSGIPNSSLTNDSVTFNGTTVALGASGSFGTDSVTEEGNLYYTDTRVRNAISLTTNNSAVLDYNSATGEFTFNLAGTNTDEVTEGSTNLYFTTQRARDSVSATDAGGDGSFSYDSATGVFTYTGPSSSEVRAHLSATSASGVSYDNTTGVISLSGIPNSSLTNSEITLNGTTVSLGGSNSFTTDAVNEGTTNKYYTSARVRSELSANDVEGSGSFSYSSSTGEFAFDATGVVATVQGYKGYVTLDTDDIGEGTTNKYYTTARTRADVSGGTGVTYTQATGVFAIGQDVSTTSNVTFNDVVVDGDLTVNGTMTAVNSTTVTIADKNLTLASGAATAAIANGAGITVDGAGATITYASATDSWNLNKDVSITGGLTITSSLTAPTFVGDLTGNVTGQVSDLSNHTTDDVAEGADNLYFTNSRAAGAISLTSDKTSVLSYNSGTGAFTFTIANASTSDIAEGTNLYFTTTRARNSISVTDNGGDGALSYDSATGVISYTGPSASEVRAHISATSASGVSYDNTTGVISLSGIPNSSLTNNSVTVNGATVALGGTTSFDTDSVDEGSVNQYYLDSRARNALSVTTSDATVFDYDPATGEFTFSLGGLDTSEVTEDPNATVTSGTMYFTNARARSAVSATDAGGDGSFSYDSTTGTFTYTGPSASETRAHFSAGTSGTGYGDLSYNSTTGAFTYDKVTSADIRGEVSATKTGGDGNFSYDEPTGTFSYTGPDATDYRLAISVTDNGGDGSLSYDDSTGVISYTGPSASEARAHFSATKVSGDGAFSYNDTTGLFSYTGPTNTNYRLAISATKVSGDGSISYNDTTGVISYTGPSDSEVRAHFSATTNTGAQYNSSTGVFSLSGIPNSSLTNSSVTVNGAQVSLGGSTSFGTDSVTEESNLYFTDSRARNAISLTTNDSTVLDYDPTTGEFTFNLGGLDTSEVAEDPNATTSSGTMYFTNARARSAISASGWQISYDSATGVISMATPDTDDVSEGSSNLYFTNARARTAVSLTTDNSDALSYNSTTGVFTFTLATVDTDEIAEGNTNLYFTTSRARNTIVNGSNIDYDASTGTISTQAAVWSVNGQEHAVVLDTDDISEGSTNLYFTNARARSALTLTTDDSNILSYNNGTGALVWTTPTTDSIDEGATNLYYTNARADDRIAAASIRDLSDVNKTASLQDGYTLVWSSVLGEFVPQNIAVQATTANFTGDGTTTSFNTGVEVSSIDNTSVFVNGLIQAPTYSYTLSTTNGETSIVFDTAPEANDYIFVRVISSAALTVGGVLNESSTVDGGSF